MSEETKPVLNCKVTIEIDFEASEVPSIMDVRRAIKLDDSLFKEITYFKVTSLTGEFEADD